MPTYRFTARDPSGGRHTGELEADGPGQAVALLEAQGLGVEDLVAVMPAGATDRLTGREVADFAGQLAGLAGAGLPLASGLRALGDELPSGALRRAFHDVAGCLEAGGSLGDAIEAQGRRVPGHLQGLVLIGLRSGRLGDVLGRYVEASRSGVEIRRKLLLGLAYPLMLLAAALALFAALCWTVIPDFGRVFAEFGIRVPIATQFLLRVAEVVARVDLWVVPALAGLVAASWLAERAFGDPARRNLLGGLPLLGTVWRWAALAEFSRLLGLLIEGEVPLPAALTLAGDGVRDARLAALARGIARDVEAGRTLAEALAPRRQFPQGYAKLVRWAERHRSLPEALEVLGAMYEARARAHATLVGAVVGVLMYAFVLGGVGFVVGALMAPFLQLMSALSGGASALGGGS